MLSKIRISRREIFHLLSAAGLAGFLPAAGNASEHSNLFISDGSQFTSSAAENPTLTIVALAIRQALHIVERMSQKSL